MANRNTLRTNAWDVVYTYLQTTNPISTNNIHSAMNSVLIASEGYPQVIIFSPNISFDKLTATGEFTESEVSMLIEIYHTSNASVKALADEVTTKLIAGRQVFAGERLMNMNITAGDYDVWDEGEKKIHRLSFNVLFRFVANGS